MCTLALPSLYRTVDISIHKHNRSWFRWMCDPCPDPDEMIEMEEDGKVGEEQFNLATRQICFITAVLKNPSLARHVVSFTWTYQRPDFDALPNVEGGEKSIWEVFGLLQNVRDLDISFFLGYHEWSKGLTAPPPPLFPHASRIRIGGNATYAIFRSILSNPSKLISLDLDNIQAFRQIKDGEGMKHTLWEAPETEDEDGWPLLRHAGPMYGHLNPLLGQFTNLQHLHLHVVGQQHYDNQGWPEDREEKRYAELAAFISSLKATLRTLVFDHGSYHEYFEAPVWDDDSDTSLRELDCDVEDLMRPMDAWFMKHILPVLGGTAWDVLEKLEINGVGGADQSYEQRLIDEALELGEVKLRMQLSPKVDLKWEHTL